MERAKVAAGDPFGGVRENLSEAFAQLGQHRMARKIWKEVQDVIAESARRAKKDKGLFGLGGTLLGSILAKAASGPLAAVNPTLASLIQAGIHAGSAGIAEKTRQDQVRATAPIKRVLAKYKGRPGVEGLDQVIEDMQAMQKQQIASDSMLSGLTAMAFPTIFGDTPVKGEAVPELGIPSGPVEFDNLALEEALFSYSADAGMPTVTTKDMIDIAPSYKEGLAKLGITPEMLQGKEGQMILGLLKHAGPTLAKMASPNIEPYWNATKPQFTNPYRRYS